MAFFCVFKVFTYPDLPDMVESKPLRPDPDHAPAIEQDDADCYGIEHGFCSELISLLDRPERIYTDGLRNQFSCSCLILKTHLSCNADDEEIRQLERVVSYHAVLQCRDDSHSRIQRVTEEEVSSRKVSKTTSHR
jgi:hypothetical protein